MSKAGDNLLLNTGARMPAIGLGTWNASPGEVGKAVEYAISECGYRHIDCAAVYRNEKEIGQALTKVFKGGAIKREEIFVTSKLWNTAHARNNVLPACKETLHDLGLEYLDLYLMHWGVAVPPNMGTEPLDDKGYLVTEKVSIRETWEAMEELVTQGLVKAIGVANFTAPMLLDLLSYAKISPAVNQIELHPYLQQNALVEFCKYKNIAVTAYSPLGSGGMYRGKEKIHVLDDPTIAKIAKEHNKTPAQILLRWAFERGTVPIPKSTSEKNLRENIGIFDFELLSAEMETIKNLDRKLRIINPSDWWKIPYFD